MVSRSAKWIAAAGAIAAACVVYAFDPSVATFFPRCVFHQLTGLQCPGCGGTRAVHQLLHGHLREALRYNALVVVSGPLLLAGSVRPHIFQRRWAGWVAVVTLVTWGVLRNVIG